jgi:hypothetical protein
MPPDGFPMEDDRIVGDGGNQTIYERPDKSRYVLDHKGRGEECTDELPVFGRARFDSRELSTGRWDDSRSRPESHEDPASRARIRSGLKIR